MWTYMLLGIEALPLLVNDTLVNGTLMLLYIATVQ